MTLNFKDACVAALAGLLGSATAIATIPWTPQNAREELSIYDDIVQADIVEEDVQASSSAPGLEECATTYAVAAVTRVLKGGRKIGEKILLGGLPEIRANFPMKRGYSYVLFLQKDLSKDEYMNSLRHECSRSSLLRKTTVKEPPFSAVYVGYRDFAIKTVDRQSSIAVWGYKGETGWLFLENYSFESTSADPDRGGTLFTTAYENFVKHLEQVIAEAAQPQPTDVTKCQSGLTNC